jgi:predicted nuclease of predicted toxin-antitoxin system
VIPLYNGMIPPSMVRRLADVWPGAKHVVTEWGERVPDEKVWAEAKARGLLIVTKDSDFSDAATFPDLRLASCA